MLDQLPDTVDSRKKVNMLYRRNYIKRPKAAVKRVWTVPQLAAAYRYPKIPAARPVKFAIGELGGGWLPSALATNFSAVGQPIPTVTDVPVDPGAGNAPGDPADFEVMLDIVCLAQAWYYITGTPAEVSIYWANNDAGGIQRAIAKAAADGCDVMSWSWGSDEATWGDIGLKSLQAAALAATTAGMLITAASGDNDSADGGQTPANVDAPASCPNVIGCGGTTKIHSSVWTTQSEYVWNNNPGNADGEGTGGGFSTYFPMPSWQNGAPHGSGRMVPDLAANADPNTGYRLFCQGSWSVIGGTSAVAPLMAGYFGGVLGPKPGFILPKLWMNHLAFWDIAPPAPVTDNGNYRCTVGPDPVSGLGVVRGSWLASILR